MIHHADREIMLFYQVPKGCYTDHVATKEGLSSSLLLGFLQSHAMNSFRLSVMIQAQPIFENLKCLPPQLFEEFETWKSRPMDQEIRQGHHQTADVVKANKDQVEKPRVFAVPPNGSVTANIDNNVINFLLHYKCADCARVYSHCVVFRSNPESNKHHTENEAQGYHDDIQRFPASKQEFQTPIMQILWEILTLPPTDHCSADYVVVYFPRVHNVILYFR